jgi:response regulator RpfG family c-di-GMP phosphodiesterase
MSPALVHTLLLVDDEPAILSAIRRSLRGESYRILTTSDPREALAILEREAVDVLVSDIDMPGMSGVELVGQVRRAFPEVVRILLTGRGSMESALRAINEGEVHRYLTKPWDEAELREVVAQAIQRLGELRRAAVAERAASRRALLYAELEREHPGITRVPPAGHVYTFDDLAVAMLAEKLGL